jgi:hypothetical protein
MTRTMIRMTIHLTAKCKEWDERMAGIMAKIETDEYGNIVKVEDEQCAMMALVEDNEPDNGQTQDWLIDSGATVHVTSDDTGMADTKPSQQQVVVIGDDTSLKREKKGTIKLANEKGQTLILKNVLHVPSFGKLNVISVMSLMKKNATGTLKTTSTRCEFEQS